MLQLQTFLKSLLSALCIFLVATALGMFIGIVSGTAHIVSQDVVRDFG
jgi:hypothetical protein